MTFLVSATLCIIYRIELRIHVSTTIFFWINIIVFPSWLKLILKMCGKSANTNLWSAPGHFPCRFYLFVVFLAKFTFHYILVLFIYQTKLLPYLILRLCVLDIQNMLLHTLCYRKYCLFQSRLNGLIDGFLLFLLYSSLALIFAGINQIIIKKIFVFLIPFFRSSFFLSFIEMGRDDWGVEKLLSFSVLFATNNN